MFEKGAEPVGTVPGFEYGPELLELELGCKHAIFMPSLNLPAIESAGIILPNATIVSMAHLSCTCDHQFEVDLMQSVVQRSVRFSAVQR